VKESMLSKRHLIIITSIAAVTLAIRWKFFPKQEKPLVDLPTADVEYIDSFIEQVTCIGRPKPGAERYATVQKGGRLEGLSIKVGDLVTAGQSLGVVDKTVNASDLKSALSSFRLAQKDYSRMAGLMRTGSASREEYDRAQSRLEVERAGLERAKQGVEDSMLRAPFSGRVSVIVFKIGDKIPDGSRVAAIEAPGTLQLACRIPTAAAAKLPEQAPVGWHELEKPDAKAITLPTVITVAQAGDFIGIDREIRLSTDSPKASVFDRRRVQVSVPLRAEANVAKLPSDAVIKRSEGYFALVTSADDPSALAWIKVDVIRRDSATAYVTGLTKGSAVLRITKDISKLESQIKTATQTDAKSDKG